MLTVTSLNNWLHLLQGLLPLVVITVLTVAAVGYVLLKVLDTLDYYRLLNRPAVVLELIPPVGIDKTPLGTQQLYTNVHGLEESRSFIDKVLRCKVAYSLEVVGTREQGIRYIIRVYENDLSIFEQAIRTYLPEAKLQRTDDYLPDGQASHLMRILEIIQTKHFRFPLRDQTPLEQHDPMAYLHGAMTQLHPNELMAVQFVVSPTKVREAEVLAHRIVQNGGLPSTGGRSINMTSVISGIHNVLFGIADMAGEVFHGPTTQSSQARQAPTSYRQPASIGPKPSALLDSFQQDLSRSVHCKLTQPLNRVSIRVLIVAADKRREKQRVRGIRDWSTSFGGPHQGLRARHDFPMKLWGQYRKFTFEHRLPSMFARNSSVFSVQELAGLYHLPHSQTGKTENVVKSLSKTLSAPLSLKGDIKLDVLLGRNHHHGSSTDIGLTADERERHVMVVGGTGTGKTTLLKYAIVQDILAGKGVAIIDPHGDLAQEVLTHIPPERLNDIIYFNPADLGYPIGLNLLEVPEGLEGDQLLQAQDFIAETVVSVMRKTFSTDGSGGHRIEYILRNATLTALTVKDATLFTVYDLLMDSDYRKPIVNKLDAVWLKSFWENEFGKAGDYQQVSMMKGVTAKIGRFHASVSADRIMSQPKSTINFDEILDGKILICNLAKGLVGEDTSEVLGIAVLAKLQLAAYGRIRQKRESRRPFYAYVDEFQNFATVSFVEMLSESRKYKLFLTMAEQTFSQQDDQNLVNNIMTNVGTLICFRSSSPLDEQQLLPRFEPSLQKGEIANLPAYNFYAKLSGGLQPQEPLSGMTLVLGYGDDDVAQQVAAASRTNYATEYVAPVAPTIADKGAGKKPGKSKKKKKDGKISVANTGGLPFDSES
jgi:hypothetical protein